MPGFRFFSDKRSVTVVYPEKQRKISLFKTGIFNCNICKNIPFLRVLPNRPAPYSVFGNMKPVFHNQTDMTVNSRALVRPFFNIASVNENSNRVRRFSVISPVGNIHCYFIEAAEISFEQRAVHIYLGVSGNPLEAK